MDELMHIDKYKIYNMGYKWTGGKKNKEEQVTESLHSDTCIDSRELMALLVDLDCAWNKHEGKDVEIEVTFKTPKED
jgi:hypothetical protein